ncbi:helix-turn-helix domain-containing protein [Enterovirga rhinocerotis]|nr:helix-turn-helix domain-containing protein [Enterovirga rhinocerotis]
MRTRARRSGSKGGRPSKMDPDKVQRVEEMKACGISDEAIAERLTLSRTTLLKHYGRALRVGRHRRRAELNEIVWREARAGKSWAVKMLKADMEAAEAEEDFLGGAKAEQPAAPKPPKLGKKEIAQQEAVTAAEGTDWGTDLEVPGATMQ